MDARRLADVRGAVGLHAYGEELDGLAVGVGLREWSFLGGGLQGPLYPCRSPQTALKCAYRGDRVTRD